MKNSKAVAFAKSLQPLILEFKYQASSYRGAERICLDSFARGLSELIKQLRFLYKKDAFLLSLSEEKLILKVCEFSPFQFLDKCDKDILELTLPLYVY